MVGGENMNSKLFLIFGAMNMRQKLCETNLTASGCHTGVRLRPVMWVHSDHRTEGHKVPSETRKRNRN